MGAIFALIIKVLKAVGGVLNPWINTTPAQQAGTKVVTAVSTAALIIGLLAAVMQIMEPLIPVHVPPTVDAVTDVLPVDVAELGLDAATFDPQDAPTVFDLPGTFDDAAPAVPAPEVIDAPEAIPCGDVSCPPKVDESEPGTMELIGEGALTFAKGLVAVLPMGCRPITPAVQAGASQIGKDYIGYVNHDPILTPEQRGERTELVCNHLRLTGTDLFPVCEVTP